MCRHTVEAECLQGLKGLLGEVSLQRASAAGLLTTTSATPSHQHAAEKLQRGFCSKEELDAVERASTRPPQGHRPYRASKTLPP